MDERKWDVNYWIKEKLKAQLYCEKKGLRFAAERAEGELHGILQYMYSVGDITEEIFNKVYKISTLIRKKYR